MYANYIVLLLMLWFIVEFVGVHCLININHLTFFYLLYTDACVRAIYVMLQSKDASYVYGSYGTPLCTPQRDTTLANIVRVLSLV